MPLIPGDCGKEVSEFKINLGQSKSQIRALSWYIPLIWATLSAGGLNKDIGRRKIRSSSPACTY
ncbi:mCG147666 [Mus musculus]|nr:mCG147666 [Mus musculus]